MRITMLIGLWRRAAATKQGFCHDRRLEPTQHHTRAPNLAKLGASTPTSVQLEGNKEACLGSPGLGRPDASPTGEAWYQSALATVIGSKPCRCTVLLASARLPE